MILLTNKVKNPVESAASNKFNYHAYRCHHHYHEHNQGLGLKTCSFKAQGVLGLSIFVFVFPYPTVPEVGTGKAASVGSFCPLVPGGLTISFNTGLCLLLCCPLLICYGCQGHTDVWI
jgi:hypothetical protein